MSNKWIIVRLSISFLMLGIALYLVAPSLIQRFSHSPKDLVTQCAAQKAQIIYEINEFEKKCEGQ